MQAQFQKNHGGGDIMHVKFEQEPILALTFSQLWKVTVKLASKTANYQWLAFSI